MSICTGRKQGLLNTDGRIVVPTPFRNERYLHVFYSSEFKTLYCFQGAELIKIHPFITGAETLFSMRSVGDGGRLYADGFDLPKQLELKDTMELVDSIAVRYLTIGPRKE